jgi:regulator of nonsense transcripts 3
LTDQRHLSPLSEKVRQTSFNDAKNTFRDPALIGLPLLEFAPYTRVPGGRRKNDTRQGTIDQDHDFQEFLESLTNPISKPHTVDADASKQEEKVTTTPLIEHLREKKAAKEKPAAKAAGKHARHESREARAVEKKAPKAAKDVAQSPEKGKRPTKADRAAREAVKVLNREAAGAVAPKQSTTESNASAASTPSTQRRRERPPVSVAAKIQRDLGLSPITPARRSAKPSTENAAKPVDSDRNKETSPAPVPTAGTPTVPQAKTSTPNKEPKVTRERRGSKSSLVEKTNVDPSQESPKIPTGPAQQKTTTQQPPKGPATARPHPAQAPKSPIAQTPAEATKAAATATPSSQSSTASRQAFLKHANASQGITEPLLHAALSPFGEIEHLEIDKRKGFAYVDFAEPEGLKAAIAASPVKVAQGAVQVLERKDRPTNSARPPLPPVAAMQHHGPPRGGFRGRGAPRGRGGRGGHAGPTPPPAVQPSTPSGQNP